MPVTIAHGIYPREPLDDAAITALVGALNAGRDGYAGRGRLQAGGLQKYEPSDLTRLPLPADRRAPA